MATLAPLRLIDLRDMGPTLLGVPSDALSARNQTAGRRLSRELYIQAPDIDGVFYTSRHVKRDCIAVYDRAVHKLSAGPVEPLITLPALAGAVAMLKITVVVTRPA